MAKEKPLTPLQQDILDYMEDSSCPVTYAKEIGEMFNITSRQASGSLRTLENRGYIVGKTIGKGMHHLKIYYFEKEKN